MQSDAFEIMVLTLVMDQILALFLLLMRIKVIVFKEELLIYQHIKMENHY